MKAKSTKILQIITGALSVLYFVGIAISFLEGGLSSLNLIDYLSLALLLIFMAGFALSWTRVKIAGIILMVWNAGAWILDLCLIRDRDQFFISIMAVPVMVIGALFLLQWYKTTKVTGASEQQQWKFILRVLLINYSVLYAIVVLSELFGGNPIDYFSLPFILYPLLLLIFLVGFVLSWRKEFYAGFVFLFWCVIMYYGSIAYIEFRQSGPWILFGVPILLQGIFYIKHHYQFRPK